MICIECAFDTARLVVSEWHSPMHAHRDLAAVVTELLTPSVTGPLPIEWQGEYSFERARSWIDERDAEGAVLLAADLNSDRVVGLLILHETVGPDDPDAVEIRLGYLLAESVWGQGHASELIAGFVAWCRGQPRLRSIVGGVAPDNIASARVLTKNGFVLTDDASPGGDQMYELVLRP